MLEIIEKKFNIRLNGMAKMKTGNGMILLNLIILQKLLKIFMFVILISYNLEQKKDNKIK